MTVEIAKTVELAKEGDINAMRKLYDNHRERILKLAFSYARNKEDAEEILQETFTKAFMALKKNKLKKNRSFSSWLYRIGINSSLDLVKKRGKIHQELSDNYSNLNDPQSPLKSPEENSIQKDITIKITRVIESLPSRQRLIFTMKHYQHMKIREIAVNLKCSEGNVKKQLFRAVHKLRTKVKPYLTEATNDL